VTTSSGAGRGYSGVGAVTRGQYIILYISICNLRQRQRNNFEISN